MDKLLGNDRKSTNLPRFRAETMEIITFLTTVLFADSVHKMSALIPNSQIMTAVKCT